MKWLGIDLEVNKQGAWNIGLAIFQGKHCLDKVNLFIEEMFTENPAQGFGPKYFKSRATVNRSLRPVWVQTLADADAIASVWIRGHGFSRSFGYNSVAFDLNKMGGVPTTLALLNSKPHIDVMPLAFAYLTSRVSYKAYWESQVALGNTHSGDVNYKKFGAELVLNYIGHIRSKGAWTWKSEPHIGAEDLIGFEYPILHYFMRLLKKGMAPVVKEKNKKW